MQTMQILFVLTCDLRVLVKAALVPPSSAGQSLPQLQLLQSLLTQQQQQQEGNAAARQHQQQDKSLLLQIQLLTQQMLSGSKDAAEPLQQPESSNKVGGGLLVEEWGAAECGQCEGAVRRKLRLSFRIDNNFIFY